MSRGCCAVSARETPSKPSASSKAQREGVAAEAEAAADSVAALAVSAYFPASVVRAQIVCKRMKRWVG